MFELRPDLAINFANRAKSPKHSSGIELINETPFLWRILPEILEHEEDLGITLWRDLSALEYSNAGQEGNEGLSLRLTAPFKAADSHASILMRDELLAECQDDKALFRMTLAAHKYRREEWLCNKVKSLLTAQPRWRQAQGLALLGYSQFDKEMFEATMALADVDRTWAEPALQNARDNWTRHKNAQYWFMQFLVEDDLIRSWAGFQLFINCVDDRFWHWSKEYVKQHLKPYVHENSSRKKAYLMQSTDDIKRKCKIFSDDCEKKFLSLKFDIERIVCYRLLD